jgi:hypothetical protein
MIIVERHNEHPLITRLFMSESLNTIQLQKCHSTDQNYMSNFPVLTHQWSTNLLMVIISDTVVGY